MMHGPINISFIYTGWFYSQDEASVHGHAIFSIDKV